VQPDDRSAELRRLGKELAVCRQRYPQAGLREVTLKASRVGWVCGDAGDVLPFSADNFRVVTP
jgi:hypothetical protein